MTGSVFSGRPRGSELAAGMVVDFHPFGVQRIVDLTPAPPRTCDLIPGALTATFATGETITIEPGRRYRRVA